MEATFTKAGGCERLEILFGDIDGANFNPKAEADYLNHLLLNHIPASTYEALYDAMSRSPEEIE